MLHAHGHLAEQYDRAADGNVALTAELAADGRRADPAGARLRPQRHAGGGVPRPLQPAGRRSPASLERYTTGWRTWQAGLRSLDRHVGRRTTPIASAPPCCAATKRPTFPGGLIASLSIPWGASKGDDDLGGYHLVWPRDLVQTAGGFLACGAFDEVRRVLRYLRAVQEADGSWPQNCWLDGTPYWHGLQLDECALPILLVDLAWRHGRAAPPATGAVLADGPRRRRVCGAQRPDHQPGPLGGERRLHPVHPRRRDRRPAGRRRPGGTLRRRRHGRGDGAVPARYRGCLGSGARRLDLRHATRRWRARPG